VACRTIGTGGMNINGTYAVVEYEDQRDEWLSWYSEHINLMFWRICAAKQRRCGKAFLCITSPPQLQDTTEVMMILFHD
jgi:hypothetical protein